MGEYPILLGGNSHVQNFVSLAVLSQRVQSFVGFFPAFLIDLTLFLLLKAALAQNFFISAISKSLVI